MTGINPKLRRTAGLPFATMLFTATILSFASVSASADRSAPQHPSAICGNGLVEDGEECDDGDAINYDSCLSNCYSARCGDGFTYSDVEKCDDGNRANNDGCDSNCTPTGCGNGIRTGSEECDDGNADETDDCLPNCDTARCGDGALHLRFEACDDGDFSNTDACLNSCSLAACGDGYTRTNVEQCDDGNSASGDGCDTNCKFSQCGNGAVAAGEECDDGNFDNSDGCLADCKTAKCGDGFLRSGFEECDDGGTTEWDGCSRDCSSQRLCGDAIRDGGIFASDSLRVLQKAVGHLVECPTWICDTDASGVVTAVDALLLLRHSVGFEAPLECAYPKAVVLYVTAARVLGSIQAHIDYSEASGDVEDTEGVANCKTVGAEVIGAFNDQPGKVLSLSLISLDGLPRSTGVATCKFQTNSSLDEHDFDVFIFDARDLQGNEVSVVGLRAVPD